MRIKIIKMIEVPVVFEGTILPGEKETKDYPGFRAETIDIFFDFELGNIYKAVDIYLEKNRTEIGIDMIEEAERLKKLNKEL